MLSMTLQVGRHVLTLSLGHALEAVEDDEPVAVAALSDGSELADQELGPEACFGFCPVEC